MVSRALKSVLKDELIAVRGKISQLRDEEAALCVMIGTSKGPGQQRVLPPVQRTPPVNGRAKDMTKVLGHPTLTQVTVWVNDALRKGPRTEQHLVSDCYYEACAAGYKRPLFLTHPVRDLLTGATEYVAADNNLWKRVL